MFLISSYSCLCHNRQCSNYMISNLLPKMWLILDVYRYTFSPLLMYGRYQSFAMNHWYIHFQIFFDIDADLARDLVHSFQRLLRSLGTRVMPYDIIELVAGLAPCRYLNQYWLIVSWTRRKSFNAILIEIQTFTLINCRWKCCPKNAVHFVQASYRWVNVKKM